MTARGRPGRRSSVDQVTRLKNRARREEHRENWSQALELYTEAIAVNEAQDSSPIDVSLYNRIGDIHLQLGRREKAVSFYERAIRHYTAQDLHTSAIALCNKVLRILPTRVGVYLHLGRLHAATGLDADARVHYERFLSEMAKLGHDTEAIEALEESISGSADRAAEAALLNWIVEAGGELVEDRLKSLRRHVERGRGDVCPVDAALAALGGPASAVSEAEPESIDDIAAELSDPLADLDPVASLDDLVAELDEERLPTFEPDGPGGLSDDEEPTTPQTEDRPIAQPRFEIIERAPADARDLGRGSTEAHEDGDRSRPPEPETAEPSARRQFARAMRLSPHPPEGPEGGQALIRPERPVDLPPRLVPDAAEPSNGLPGFDASSIAAAGSEIPREGDVMHPEGAIAPAWCQPVETREFESGPPSLKAVLTGPTLVPDPAEGTCLVVVPPAPGLDLRLTTTGLPPDRLEAVVHESLHGRSMCGFLREAPEPTSVLSRLALPLPTDLFESELITGRDALVPYRLPFELPIDGLERPTNGGPGLVELLSALRRDARHGTSMDGPPSAAEAVDLIVQPIPRLLDKSERPLRANGLSAEIPALEASERTGFATDRSHEVDASEREVDLARLVEPVTTAANACEPGEGPSRVSERARGSNSIEPGESCEPASRLPRRFLPAPQVETVEAYDDPFRQQLETGIDLRQQGDLGGAIEAFGLALASPDGFREAWDRLLECRTELEAAQLEAAQLEAPQMPKPSGETEIDEELEAVAALDLTATPEAAEEVDLVGEPVRMEAEPEAPESTGARGAIEEPERPKLSLEPESIEPAAEPETVAPLEAAEEVDLVGEPVRMEAEPEAPEIDVLEAAAGDEPEPKPEPIAEPPTPARSGAPGPVADPVSAPAATPGPALVEAEPEPFSPHVQPAEQVDDSFLKFVRTAPPGVLPAAFQELERRGELAKALLVLDRQLETRKDDLELLTQRAKISSQLGRTTEAVADYLSLGVCAGTAGDTDVARWAYRQVLELEPHNGPALAAIQDVEPGEVAAISAAGRGEPMIDSRLGSTIGGGVAGTRPPAPPQPTVRAPTEDRLDVRPYGGVAGGNEATLDFERLVSEFRAELAESTVEADTCSRTELGANLKSMGLLDDAIRELQGAIREPEAPPTAYELLGEAFIEKGQARVATRILSRALEEADRTDREMLGVLYQLGVAYETVNEFQLALDCYERVFSVDIDYRDVKDRISLCARST